MVILQLAVTIIVLAVFFFVCCFLFKGKEEKICAIFFAFFSGFLMITLSMLFALYSEKRIFWKTVITITVISILTVLATGIYFEIYSIYKNIASIEIIEFTFKIILSSIFIILCLISIVILIESLANNSHADSKIKIRFCCLAQVAITSILIFVQY